MMRTPRATMTSGHRRSPPPTLVSASCIAPTRARMPPGMKGHQWLSGSRSRAPTTQMARKPAAIESSMRGTREIAGRRLGEHDAGAHAGDDAASDEEAVLAAGHERGEEDEPHEQGDPLADVRDELAEEQEEADAGHDEAADDRSAVGGLPIVGSRGRIDGRRSRWWGRRCLGRRSGSHGRLCRRLWSGRLGPGWLGSRRLLPRRLGMCARREAPAGGARRAEVDTRPVVAGTRPVVAGTRPGGGG